MKSRSKLVIVVLLLLSVATIFISPAVDLQPTALRALQLANLFFAFLALGATAACYASGSSPVAGGVNR